jgi:2-polyprenyl-3-methyl-5-hydroxy-6-metoxy-1,4-benzoquinol methylase
VGSTPSIGTKLMEILRPCPICGVAQSRPYLRKNQLELVQCTACAMIYVRRVEIAFAEGSFYETEGAEFYLSENKLRGDFSAERYRREIALLRRHVKRGAVLDVGCSTGGFLFNLDRSYPGDYQIFGTDVPSAATRHAETKGVTVLPGDFLSAGQDLQFDAITFWAVLEHVAAPKDFLIQAERLLKPGGVCIVLVPNIRSLAVRFVGARYRYILPQHLNYFARDTLTRLVASTGLRVFQTTTMHFNPVVIWQDRTNASGVVSDSKRAELLTKTNALKERSGLLPLRMGYAASEKLLACLGLADNVVVVGKRIV